ncbi:T9SS type A sorting domain-containing protein [Aquimarina litoralis]|uniref:T9SS type A sorting domain-containing protein n=1 Tax=Aquimarina litoralis TaxID=584605 RepID=UPI001C59A593|nr:T9SS type A sorting domain-containing protein [Aquimarina litoralis]MBW1295817.1 T9SS type A sorting domain-containing protein [Aquimarina litoralis]
MLRIILFFIVFVTGSLQAQTKYTFRFSRPGGGPGSFYNGGIETMRYRVYRGNTLLVDSGTQTRTIPSIEFGGNKDWEVFDVVPTRVVVSWRTSYLDLFNCYYTDEEISITGVECNNYPVNCTSVTVFSNNVLVQPTDDVVCRKETISLTSNTCVSEQVVGWHYSLDGVNYENTSVTTLSTNNTAQLDLTTLNIPPSYTGKLYFRGVISISTGLFQSITMDSDVIEYNLIPCSPELDPNISPNPEPINPICSGDTNGRFRMTFDRDIGSQEYISAPLDKLEVGNQWIQQTPLVSINPGDLNASLEYTWPNDLAPGRYRVKYQSIFNGSQVGSDSPYYEFTIGTPTAVTFNTSSNSPSCVSGQGTSNNGSITISGVNGGTPPYKYSINGSSFTTFSGNSITLARGAGTYSIRVKDNNDCDATSGGNTSISETINAATAITIANTPPVNVTQFGGTNGSISPGVSGGTTPPLTYSWTGPNGFSSSQQNISGLRAGTYTLTVRDNPEGCSTSRSFIVTEPNQLLFNYPASITSVDCNGNTTGAISITASGGLPDYRFELLKDNGSGTFTTTGDQLDTSNLTTATFSVTGLSGGDYKVRLTDNRNNSNPDVVIESITLTIQEPDPFQIQNINPIDALCRGEANGSIELDIIGGTGVYEISMTKSGDAGFNRVISNIPNNSLGYSIDNLAEGTYTLTLTDSNSCTVINPTVDRIITVGEPTTEVSVNTLSVASPTSGNADGSISVQGQGGTGGGYTYLWNTGATTSSISNLADGNYSVTVRDANGCPAVENYTLNELDVTITITPGEEVFCDTDTAGFTANPTGGDNNYSYNWYNQNNLTNSIGTNQTINGLTDGNYVVIVNDGTGASVTSAAVNVNIPDPVVITSVIPTEVNCFGGNDGTLTINATGGTGVLEYSIDNGSTYQTNNTDTFIFTNLAANTYEIIVKDANNCESSVFTETVTGPTNPITIPGTETDVTIFGQNTGAITINPTGGNSGYTYSWTGPNGFSSTDKDISNLFAGTYTVTVRDNRFGSTSDNSGCTASQTFTVSEPDELLVTIAYETPSSDLKCNGDDNARLLATVSGGNTPYTYNWFKETFVGSGIFDPLADTTALLMGVDEGNYRVEIGDPNGAMTFDEFYVDQPDPLGISIAETEINCFGDATGAIDITVSGGTTPYTYLWSNGETSEDISGLLTGDYSVIVTDANDCILSSTTINIEQPAAPLEITNETIQELSGFETSNGSIDITVSGGTSPYTYEWRVQGNTTVIGNASLIENLASNTYEVTIIDDNNCILIQDYFVDQPDLLEITNIQLDNPLQCFGDTTVSLTATVAGGVTPYNYRWYNTLNPTTDLSTTSTITNLGEGTYIIEIIDANGNQTSETTTIVNPPLLEASFTSENVSCNGGNDASIDITVTGGTGAYSFFWSNGANTEDISGLSIGTYDLTIRDANLCETTLSVTITEPLVGLNIADFTITDASGNGLSNGSIEVVANGGTPAYTYNWTDNTNTPIGTNSNILNNVEAGSYFLTLTDTNNCILGPIEYIVGEPDPLLVTIDETSIACFGENGELFAIVTGGVTPYSYEWFDSTDTVISTTSNTGPIPTGQYRVVVTDANLNQTEVPNIDLTQPDLLEVTNIVVTDVSCYNGSDGSIEITVAGGTGAYSYRWNTLGSTTNILDGIPEGAYQVTVTDENTCSVDSQIINVGQPVVYDIINTAIIRPSGTGTNDGSISITITGGVAPFTYQWTDNNAAIVQLESNTTSITSTLSNQSEGVYNILITDADGCTITDTYNLANPGELLVEITQTQAVSCFGGSDGILEVITTGGVGGNTYQWFDATNNTEIGNSNILNGIGAGSYYIIVSNAEGVSEQSAIFNVTQPLPVTGNLVGDAPDCFGGSDGSITITASGGNNSYSYRYRLINGVYSNWIPFDNGMTTQITNLADGIYQVQLQDSNGCFYEDNGNIGVLSIRLNQPDQLILDSVVLTDPTGFGLTNGSIATTIAGGTPPYTYQWNDTNGILNETSSVLTNIGAGTYTIAVTDALGCQTSQSFTLNQPDQLLVTTDIVNVILCNSDTNGSIRAIATGGIGTYTYQWFEEGNNTVIGTDALLDNIGAGTYYVIVTDANNNTVQSPNIIVTEPDELLISLSADFILCGDGNDWNIESSVTGGTAPYSYLWDGGNGTAPNLVDVLPGTYVVTVQDSRGCSQSATITLTPPEPLTNSFVTNDPTCFNGNDGTIDITPTGGTPPYTFFWDNGANTEDLSGLSSGSYSVEIFDSKGCSIIQDFELIDPDELIIDLGPDKTLCLGQSYTVDAAISDPGATYSWTGDNGFTATSSEVTLSESGSYTVSVTTSLGCISIDTIEIIALENEISAEFLVSTDLFVNESFIIVDVSNPLPDTLEWILPEAAQQVDITDRYAEIMFSEEGEYIITLRTTIGDCETFFSKTITVREAVFDRDDENQSGLQQYLMYPNPTKGNFTIELSFDKETPVDVKLFSIANNSLIYQYSDEQQTAYTIPFNLEGIVPTGLYFVLLETPEKSYVRKIVVE